MTSDHHNPADNSDNRPTRLLDDMSPSADDWKNWRERGGAPLFAAVLLSLNIHPLQMNRDALPTVDPSRNEEFNRRYDIAKHRYGQHHDLPAIEHVNFSGPGAQFVEFDGFLAFAKEMGWDNLDEFKANLFPNAEPPSNRTSRLHSLEDVPKGEKYNLVRIGALLDLLEEIGRGDFDPTQLVVGGELNISEVAKKVQEIVHTAAIKNNKRSVYGYSEEANRKNFGDARRALNNPADV